jgi:hypothetical protein
MSDDALTHRTLLAPALLPRPRAEDTNDARTEGPDGPNDGDGAEAANAPAEPVPPGEPLAEILVEGLKRRGWAVDYRWTTYDGHAFDARRRDNRYDVEVKCLDTEATEGRGLWLVTAKRRTGFFRRFFQGRSDPAEHRLLRLHIDECLAGDPRTVAEGSEWKTEEDFAKEVA